MDVSSLFSWLLRLAGIDRAVAYVLFTRIWSLGAGPVTLFFVATFLSPEEQGYYYTFGSVLALQGLFELGLTYVVLQFASHEKARLAWTSEGTLEGDETAKARLSSLLRKAFMWNGWVGGLLIATVLPAGLFFFDHYQPSVAQVAWHLPWVWATMVTAGIVVVTPLFALLDGCGLVAEIAALRLRQIILGNALAWLVFALGGGLLAAPVLNTVALLWGIGWLLLRKRRFFIDLVTYQGEVAINWRKEVWSFQWKIALSGVCGYLIFQLFNPVLFAFHGAAAAGRMGMSMALVNSLAGMASAWIYTKVAPYGGLIANRDFKTLNRMFYLSLWQSTLFITVSEAALWVVTFAVHRFGQPLSQRLLEPMPFALLAATTVISHIVTAEAVYLRAHKREPFLGVSLVSACLSVASTWFLGRQFGATGMLFGFFFVTLVVGLGAGTWIFRRKRRLWHEGTVA